MDKKVYKTLEFDKILGRLSEFGVLDKTKEALLSLIPNTDINMVSKLNLDTDNAMCLIIKSGNPPIYNFFELDSIIKRLSIGGSLSQGELLRVSTLLKTARQLIEYLKDDSATFKDRSLLFANKRFEEELFAKIISDEEIADTASDDLYKIRRQKLAAHSKIREALQKFTNSQNYKKYLQNSTVAIRNDRFVLPVKQEFKGEIEGLIHSSSDSGATIFVEPMVIVNLNNSLKELESKEKEEIEKILIYLSGQASGIVEEIASNYSIILSLDLIFAKAKYSLSIKGEVPILNDKGIINLKKAVHPLLDPKTAVPIDISIGDGFDTLVITGPNTGGKTVSLKTVGLFTLMAQCGIAIPAFSGSEIAVFKNICADIGDEQSIEQSLSTFSSHMTNIASIINNLSKDSLLLFDELGAGTDPTEGAALAIAIVEYLRKKGARVLATTHYPEIKLYALSQKGVINASLEFSVETLMPTYRLIMGMPGKSNAFAISKKLGLLDEILDIAEEHISSDALKFEDVLTVIDEQRKFAEKEKTEAENLKLKVMELEKELNSKKEYALTKNREIIEQARVSAVEIIDQAREKAEEIIKQLNEESKSQKDRARAVGDVRRRLIDERKTQETELDLEKQKGKNPISIKDIKIGLSVLLDGFDKPVTIDSIPDGRGNLTVLAGIMKVKTNITKLSKCELQVKKDATSKYRNVAINKNEIRPELDLRGMDLFEAEYATEKFIDDAILSRIPALTIIHGKGTGVLRSGIHQLLKKNKAVKFYRLGTFGEGESGVTLVELK